MRRMPRPMRTLAGFRTVGFLLVLASGCTGATGTTGDHAQDSGPGDSSGPAFENLTPPAWPADIYVDVAADITVPTYTLTPDIVYYDYYKNAETTPYRVGNTTPVHTPRSTEGIVAGDSLHIVARAVYNSVEYPGVSSEPKVVQATPASALTATTQIASIQWTLGALTSPVTPVTASGGTPPYAFSVSPALPTPLQMDASTGEIGSGTVGGTSPSMLYTVTVTDSAPSPASAQATFTAVVTTGVGNPELFTESVFEMDFDQGANGRYRAHGGAWLDFDSWQQGCSDGGGYCRTTNGGVYVESPGFGANAGAVRTELVTNALGTGRVLHTWIEQGDEMHSSATYPRTELYSNFTSEVPFGDEWRLELPLYASGDLDAVADSIIGWQFHSNGDGSPPFGLYLSNGMLRLYMIETDSGPETPIDLLPLQANTRVDMVAEMKFGYPAQGAYLRLWINGTKYVDITDMNIGYPDTDTVAGWWKFCSLYDWGNNVTGTRSLYCGPQVKFLRKP